MARPGSPCGPGRRCCSDPGHSEAVLGSGGDRDLGAGSVPRGGHWRFPAVHGEPVDLRLRLRVQFLKPENRWHLFLPFK